MKSKFKPGDIIHWKYDPVMAAQEGWGIVFDNSDHGKPYHRWPNHPVFGFVRFSKQHRERAKTNYEMGEVTEASCFVGDDRYRSVHIEKNPCGHVLDGIKYSVYLLNKNGLIDNLSLIEVLDQLRRYA